MHILHCFAFLAITIHSFNVTDCRRIAKQEPEVVEQRIQRSTDSEKMTGNMEELLKLFRESDTKSDTEVREKRNNDSKKNMALLMSFINKEFADDEQKPKKKLKNTKTATYVIETDKTEDLNAKKINNQLIRQLLESGLATKTTKKLSKSNEPIENRLTKNKRDNDPDSYELSEELDDPILLLEEVTTPSNSSNKKDCYRNVYKNVLDAFEGALRIQMEHYKKCMCTGKKLRTTTMSPYATTLNESVTYSTSTQSPTTSDYSNDRFGVLDQFAVRHGKNGLAKEDDVICFNKKFAIILKDLLNSYNLNDTQEVGEETLPNTYNQNLTRSNRKVNKFTSSQEDLDFDEEKIVLKNGGKVDSEKSMKQLIEENLLIKFMEYLKTQQVQENDELISKIEAEDKEGKNSNRVEIKASRSIPNMDSASEVSNEDDSFDMTKLLEELKGLFPAPESIKESNETKNQEKPFLSIPKLSKNKRSEDSVKSTKKTKRKSPRISSEENIKETSRISKRRSITSGSDESLEKVIRKASKSQKWNEERRDTKGRADERTSSNHKSANNARKKISLSIDVPKSARGIIKKIKYDYE